MAKTRLYRRIYLHGLMLLVLVVIAAGIVGTLLGRTAVWSEYPLRLATHLARQVGPLRSRPRELKQSRIRNEINNLGTSASQAEHMDLV